MTHNPSNTIETDEIEFTAKYGTAVTATCRCQPDVRNDQPAALPEAVGPGTSEINIADATKTHSAHPRILRYETEVPGPAHPS